ncbi:hypothetical protein IFR05_010739 [Cadophora sp. M221]|nr:hypothetical protein IFR05_010739 [Cadophora sp. M221]
MMRTWRRSYLRLTHPIPRQIAAGGRARFLSITSWPPVIQTTSTRPFHNGTYSPPKSNSWRPAIPQSSSHFKYKPLTGSSAIRLVILEAGRGQDPVKCRLIHVSLDDDPQYEALSYAWGDPSVTTPIYLDGKTFSVTENLEAALVNLRDESLGNPKNRVLWIDAICINQLHILERNDQVHRMRRIYGNAVTVLIWLGRYHEAVDPTTRFDIDTSGIILLAEGTKDQTARAFDTMMSVFSSALQGEDHKLQALIASATTTNWAHLDRLLRRP